jgi:hypothetical protein
MKQKKKKKVNKKISINEFWKHPTLLTTIIILLAAGLAYSYGTNNPNTFGHSYGELGIPTCQDGQLLIMRNGIIECWTLNVDVSKHASIIENNGVRGVYYYEAARYHTSINAQLYAGKTYSLDHNIITDYCGDFDGCEIRLGLKNPTTNSKEVISKHTLLYYNSQDGTWRTENNNVGIDTNTVINHVINVENTCYLTDAEYPGSYTSGTDLQRGFGLLLWNGRTGPERTCELTITD